MSNLDIQVQQEDQLTAWKKSISEIIEEANASLRANADIVAADTQQQLDAAIELAAISVRGVAAEAAEAMAHRAGQAVVEVLGSEVGRLLELIEKQARNVAATSPQKGKSNWPPFLWFSLGIASYLVATSALSSLDLTGVKDAFSILKSVTMGVFK